MNATTDEDSLRLYLKIQMYDSKLILSSGPLIVGAINYIMAPLQLMNPNFLSVADSHVDATVAGSQVTRRTHCTDLFAVDTQLY